MQILLYIARYKNGKLIAYSEDMEMLFNYLKSFYQRPGKENIEINIVKEPNISIHGQLYTEYEEYQLVYFWDSIVMTEWEYPIYDEYFRNYRETVLESMKKMSRNVLEGYYKLEEVTDLDILNHLKKTLDRGEYLSMLVHEKFMERLGTSKIQSIINDSDLTYYMYQMNREYERQINNDN